MVHGQLNYSVKFCTSENFPLYNIWTININTIIEDINTTSRGFVARLKAKENCEANLE